jgi:hypothetical protein
LTKARAIQVSFSKKGAARRVHRTKRTKGGFSRRTGLAMAFSLMMSAQKEWRKLDGQNRLPEIIQGVEFRDGLRLGQASV